MLSTLSFRAPMLMELEFDEPASVLDTIMTSLGGLKYLQSFTSHHAISKDLFTGLSLLPQLISLHCRLRENLVPSSPSRLSSQNCFPSLEYLHVTTRTSTLFCCLFQLYFSRSPIHDIHLVIAWIKQRGDISLPARPLSALEIILKEQHFRRCIVSLDITQFLFISKLPRQTLEFIELVPFFECDRLRSLSIDAGYMLEGFDNPAIKRMAAAWRHLEHLRMESGSKKRPLECTLRCLKYLAYNCPALKKLEISFSSLAEQEMVPVAGPKSVQLELKSLHTGFSPLAISAAHSVALYLARLFPNLASIESSYRSHHLGAQSWREVLRLYKEYTQKNML